MLLKLLDRSDILRYGKTIIELPGHIAQNLLKAKRAIEYIGNVQEAPNNKMMGGPPKDKMVWASPERKAFDEPEKSIPFPGVNDPLFPEHIIGRN